MILVDFSSITLAHILAALPKLPELNEQIIRHLVLNSLVHTQRKFRSDYGELVICCDSKGSWRKETFPYYKANRKNQRAATTIDWNLIYSSLNSIIEDLHVVFPYKTIKVDRAEADDIIAVLIKNQVSDKYLIVSNDKDFNQFQYFYKNVDQFMSLSEKFYKVTFNEAVLNYYKHIISGDAVDGIPNIFSDDDAIVNINKRQNRVTQKRQEEVIKILLNNESLEEKLPDIAANYTRNKTLIDLSKVPDDIEKSIMEAFTFEGTNPLKAKDRSQILNYLTQHKLKNLMTNLADF